MLRDTKVKGMTPDFIFKGNNLGKAKVLNEINGQTFVQTDAGLFRIVGDKLEEVRIG